MKTILTFKEFLSLLDEQNSLAVSKELSLTRDEIQDMRVKSQRQRIKDKADELEKLRMSNDPEERKLYNIKKQEAMLKKRLNKGNEEQP